MKILSHCFTLLLSFLLVSLGRTVYFIQDLQGLTATPFSAELATWTVNTGATLAPSGGYPVSLLFNVGYPQKQISKTYTGIDDHHYIAFTLGMYLESSCTGNILQMSFDDVQTQMLVANGLASSPTGFFYIKGGVPHSGSTLTVTITSKLTACLSFRYGIRELNMNFMKNLESTEQQLCHTLLTAPQLSPVCGCGPAQIEGGGTLCVSCSNGCLDCGKIVSGIETCSKCDSSQLLEWDGETCSTCGSHCGQCAGLMGSNCRSCLNGHFFYGNGTCIQGCPLPLKQVPSGGLVQNCTLPCGDSEWLYPDSSCKGSCPSYFVEKTDVNGIRWCKSPCEKEQDYFNEEKGTCEGSCEYPNEAGDVGGIGVCLLNLDEGQTEQVQKTSKAVNGINSGSSGAILALSFLSSSDSSSTLMGAFSKMLQYIKYMDIVYPAKVRLMLEMTKSNSSSTGGFASKLMRKELDKFPKRELPEKFGYYGAKSSFFVNYWPSLFTLLVLFFVTVMVMLLGFCSKSCVKVKKILVEITGILKWNMILLLFCGDFGDIVFFTALELTTVKMNSFESVWSLIVCLAMNLFAFGVLLKILSVNFDIRKEKQQQQEGKTENKWGSYKTFFAIYKDQSYFQQIFLFVFIIRVSIFNAVIGYFFNYPLTQAILITLTNLAMLLYLIFKRPMKALINSIQQIVLEGFLLIFNICLCILAGLDHNGIGAYEFRDGVGEVMMMINIIVPIVSIVILIAKILIMGVEAYKDWKAEKAKQKNIEKKDIRIELPRKQKTEVIDGTQSMVNSSNILDMSSSNASFMNNSQPWINVQEPNEKNRGPRNPRWSQTQISNVSDFGIFDQSTSSFFPDQASNSLPQEIGTFSMPFGQVSPDVKILKSKNFFDDLGIMWNIEPKIKRNRPLKLRQSQVRGREMEVVFENA